MTHHPTRVLAVIGAALVLMIGGAVAYAAIPAADGTITACMLKPGGTIRLIDAEAGATCKKTEQKVEWNQEGQPGPPGVLSPDDLYTATNNGGEDVLAGFDAYSLCDVGDTVLGAITMHVSGSTRWELNEIEHTATGAEGMGLLVYDQGAPHGSLVRAQCLDTAEPSH